MAESSNSRESEVRSDVRLLRRLFTLVPWRMRSRIVLLVLASGVTALLDIVGILALLPLMQMLTSRDELPGVLQSHLVPLVGTDDRQDLLLAMALIVGGAFVLKNAVTAVLRYWSISITQDAAAAAQSTMLARYTGASYASHRRRSKAMVLQTVSSAIPAAFGLLLGYISILVDSATVVVIFVTLLAVSPLASLTAVVIFGGAALLMSRVFKPWALRFAVQSLDLNTAAWGYLNPAIEGFRESRIFNKEELFTGAYRRNRQRISGLNAKSTMLVEAPKYLFEIVLILGVVVVALLLFGTQEESTAFGLLAVFAAASVRIIPAFNRLVATLNGLRGARPSLHLVGQQMGELDDEPARGGLEDQAVVVPDGDISVEGLSFRYPDGNEDTLKNVTVTIPRGSTVALVGASGAGKTTFADILAGLLTGTEGAVTVGGYDIADHPRSWRSQVGMVSQKVYIWEASLRDLITFGEPSDDIDHAHLSDVIRRARLDDLVARLPEGLDTIIGEGGSRLSGGQVQRVGIARALYVDPEVLILDEATSALDNETEHEITRTMEALHGEITVVIVAHRLSTVKHADQILFFSQGRLQSRGTMSELAATDPDFSRLVELGSLT